MYSKSKHGFLFLPDYADVQSKRRTVNFLLSRRPFSSQGLCATISDVLHGSLFPHRDTLSWITFLSFLPFVSWEGESYLIGELGKEIEISVDVGHLSLESQAAWSGRDTQVILCCLDSKLGFDSPHQWFKESPNNASDWMVSSAQNGMSVNPHSWKYKATLSKYLLN